MRMDRRFSAMMAASLLWALLVAAVFYRMAGGSGRRVRAEAERPLVVATQMVPLGAVLGRDAVKLRPVPESMFPAGGFSRVEDVLERSVISTIQPDEPVLDARLAARGSGIGLAPLIPAGMRAIAVRVNDVVGVAGFVLPGMRVDVLVTARPPGRSDTYTRTVLQNILVLSAGQTIQTDAKSQSINAPVVTLLVDPAEAEVLTLANAEGRIQLVLRNSTDRQNAGTRGRQMGELFGAVAPEPVAAAAPASAKARRPAPPSTVRPTFEAVPRLPPVRPPAPPENVVLIRGNVKTLEPAAPKGGGK
jgi:pilus assembly protein CpaB